MSERANCDVCDKRPWTHRAMVYGIETFFCDVCGGYEDSEKENKETSDQEQP